MPSGKCSVPPESDSETTRPPSSMTFCAAYCATLPEPEIATRLPSKLLWVLLSISSAKYTQP